MLHMQLSKFVVVGISNSIISYLVFIITFNSLLIGNAFASQAISYSAGILWSFFWNEKWTFSSERRKSILLISFFFLQITLLVLSSLMMGFAEKYLDCNITLMWFLVMGFITVINFILSKTLVFKS